MICTIFIFKLFLLLEILQNATNKAMASDNSHMEELELKLDLPYKAVDSKYMEGLKDIENKTGISIKIFVHIKGNFDQIEEAKKRIIDIEYTDKIPESENTTCKEQYQYLLNLINNNKKDIQAELETMANKSKENIEEIKSITLELRAEYNLEIKEIKNDFENKANDMQDSLFKDIVDSIGYVDLNKFYESDEYINAYKTEGEQPIHTASTLGRIDVVKILIQSGTSVDTRNNKYWTPLHFASIYGRLNIVKHLLNVNASINALSIYGETPLMWAASMGQKSIVEYLCYKKAKVDIKANDNSTALDLAHGDDKNEIIQILKKCGVTHAHDFSYPPFLRKSLEF